MAWRISAQTGAKTARMAQTKNKKTRDKALNQKRKIINLKFKINTKFQHLKIHAEFKIVKIIKILKITAQTNNQNFKILKSAHNLR